MTVQHQKCLRLHVVAPNCRPATTGHTRRVELKTNHPKTSAAPEPPPVGAAGQPTQVTARRPDQRPGPIDWSSFGQVIPVLAGSPGAGASVLSAVLSDAVQVAGLRTLLVDAADPVRSGLAMAARHAGPWVRGPHPAICIRYSWRAQAMLAQLETWLPVLGPGAVPPPRFWHPGSGVQVTIVDIGHEPWHVAAHPATGAGEWLRCGSPMPVPVLVVRATRPSLAHAEQVLSRLEPWISASMTAAPAQLVVMGAKRWPPGVAGSAGRRVATLLSRAIFVPYDRGIATIGVSADVTPERLRRSVLPFLGRLGKGASS